MTSNLSKTGKKDGSSSHRVGEDRDITKTKKDTLELAGEDRVRDNGKQTGLKRKFDDLIKAEKVPPMVIKAIEAGGDWETMKQEMVKEAVDLEIKARQRKLRINEHIQRERSKAIETMNQELEKLRREKLTAMETEMRLVGDKRRKMVQESSSLVEKVRKAALLGGGLTSRSEEWRTIRAEVTRLIGNQCDVAKREMTEYVVGLVRQFFLK